MNIEGTLARFVDYFHGGREYDRLTGLYRSNGSCYDPRSGRYIAATNAQLNPYTFAKNSPINWDPNMASPRDISWTDFFWEEFQTEVNPLHGAWWEVGLKVGGWLAFGFGTGGTGYATVGPLVMAKWALIGLNLSIWQDVCAMGDALRKDQPINPSNMVSSPHFWQKALKFTTIGAALPAAPAFATTLGIPTAAQSLIGTGLGAYGVYHQGGAALEHFRQGNIFQGIYHTGTAGLSGYFGYRSATMRGGIFGKGGPYQNWQAARVARAAAQPAARMTALLQSESIVVGAAPRPIISQSYAGAGISVTGAVSSVRGLTSSSILAMRGVRLPRPRATEGLARAVADVERPPMNDRRTVVVLETREGRTLVAGGKSDLSGAQKTLATELGLTVVRGVPGEDAEISAIMGAARLGLKPMRGATTNRICPDCQLDIESLGGKVTGPRSFEFGFDL